MARMSAVRRSTRVQCVAAQAPTALPCSSARSGAGGSPDALHSVPQVACGRRAGGVSGERRERKARAQRLKITHSRNSRTLRLAPHEPPWAPQRPRCGLKPFGRARACLSAHVVQRVGRRREASAGGRSLLMARGQIWGHDATSCACRWTYIARSTSRHCVSLLRVFCGAVSSPRHGGAKRGAVRLRHPPVAVVQVPLGVHKVCASEDAHPADPHSSAQLERAAQVCSSACSAHGAVLRCERRGRGRRLHAASRQKGDAWAPDARAVRP